MRKRGRREQEGISEHPKWCIMGVRRMEGADQQETGVRHTCMGVPYVFYGKDGVPDMKNVPKQAHFSCVMCCGR